MPRSQYTPQYEVFLELLRQARKRRGVTQAALATRLRMTQSMISKIETGERRLDVVELRQFCRAIGTPFLQLVKELDRRLAAD